MKILALVPARGGSRGIPGKNIRELSGKPLLAYTAEAARQSNLFDRTVLSTDSEKIAAVGRRFELDSPFLRPAELAADDTPMLPVVEHALEQLADDGFEADIIVLLQPTAPLRRPHHIQDAIQILRNTGCDSVVSVVEVPRHYSPDFVLRLENDRLRPFLPQGERVHRRQDARQSYSRDGTVYAFWRSTLTKYGSIYGEDCRPFVIPRRESINLDNEDDWLAAERWLRAPAEASGD